MCSERLSNLVPLIRQRAGMLSGSQTKDLTTEGRDLLLDVCKITNEIDSATDLSEKKAKLQKILDQLESFPIEDGWPGKNELSRGWDDLLGLVGRAQRAI